MFFFALRFFLLYGACFNGSPIFVVMSVRCGAIVVFDCLSVSASCFRVLFWLWYEVVSRFLSVRFVKLWILLL